MYHSWYTEASRGSGAWGLAFPCGGVEARHARSTSELARVASFTAPGGLVRSFVRFRTPMAPEAAPPSHPRRGWPADPTGPHRGSARPPGSARQRRRKCGGDTRSAPVQWMKRWRLAGSQTGPVVSLRHRRSAGDCRRLRHRAACLAGLCGCPAIKVSWPRRCGGFCGRAPHAGLRQPGPPAIRARPHPRPDRGRHLTAPTACSWACPATGPA